MRTTVVIALLLLPLATLAEFYKWQGPEGRIHYSDRPVPGAEPMRVKVDQGEEESVSEEPVAGEGFSEADSGPYDSFEILAPEQNQTLREAEGRTVVSLLIDPIPSGGERIEIVLDGHPLPGGSAGAQMQLQGIGIGSHRIQARIRDELDEVIASSPVVDFHMRTPVPEAVAP